MIKYLAVYKRRNNRKRQKENVPFLCDEMIFQILVRLPADILFNVMRYVCKQWYNIIKDPRFIREQVVFPRSLNDGGGGLCFHRYEEQTVYFAHFGQEKATLSELIKLPSPDYRIFSVCDGLVLFHCEVQKKAYIANPLKKQLLTLPSVSPMTNCIHYWLRCVGSAMEYKVLFICQENRTCGVLTLGKDKTWRNLDVPPSSPDYPSVLDLSLVENGKFIHWFGLYGSGMTTFDMESERFSFTASPKKHFIGDYCGYVPLERGGCVVYMVGRHGNTLWEVWTLTHNTYGEFMKVFDIDFRPQKCRSDDLSSFLGSGEVRPVAWIDNEVLILRDFLWLSNMISHNIRTGHTYQLMSCHDYCLSRGIYRPYASTLLSIS